MKITLDEVAQINSSIYNGKWKDAKALVMKGCKSNPELMARRLGTALINLSSQGLVEEACKFNALFDNNEVSLSS